MTRFEQTSEHDPELIAALIRNRRMFLNFLARRVGHGGGRCRSLGHHHHRDDDRHPQTSGNSQGRDAANESGKGDPKDTAEKTTAAQERILTVAPDRYSRSELPTWRYRDAQASPGAVFLLDDRRQGERDALAK